MKKVNVYQVWVDSAARGGAQWRGTFSHEPLTLDILEAIELDIMESNPTVEHEADRIREYQRLQEVVSHCQCLVSYTTEVSVADVKLGEIRIKEEKIFVK
jgi:hypothetical protein